MSLTDVINEQAEGFRGKLGVSVKHLGTGETTDLNGDVVFPTASVFKVPVIVEFYRRVERGRISLDEQILLKESDKVPGSGILKELSEFPGCFIGNHHGIIFKYPQRRCFDHDSIPLQAMDCVLHSQFIP